MELNYYFNVSYTDESGLWPKIWDTLKDQLRFHDITIKYKD